jgi:acyl dehydratase
MSVITDVTDLHRLVGQELGVSAWRTITQSDVDAFAEATGDHQWIHTDPERARSTPFGGTIVHGYFTLALAPSMMAEVLDLTGAATTLNYGLDRLRFPDMMPVGDALRLRLTLDDLRELSGGGTSLHLTMTFERRGGTKPVCVAQVIFRVIASANGAPPPA